MSGGRPFLALWRELVAHAELTTAEKAIAWRAADYANSDGSSVRPGTVRLAHECGLKVLEGAKRQKAVERAFGRLVDLGLAVQVGQGYRGRVAEYRLTIPQRGILQSPSNGERGIPQSPKGDSPVPPPTQTSVRSPAATRQRATHPFADDGSGLSCLTCKLPPGHAAHREAS